MDVVTAIIASVVGVGIGAIIGVFAIRKRYTPISTQLSDAKEELEAVKVDLVAAQTRLELLDRAESDLATSRTDLANERESRAAESATLKAQAEAAQKTILELQTFKDAMIEEFEKLAAVAVEKSHDSFIKKADETFLKHREGFTAEGEKREEAIEKLVNPVNETLAKYETSLTEMEKQRLKHHSELQSELKNVIESQHGVRTETAKLVTALRAQPKTRGRWGEETLRNAMELAGMAEHCDFVTEKTVDVDDARYRPDVVVYMPGGRSIVIDAKVPMDAFLNAIEAVDDVERDLQFKRHAGQVREHVRLLSSKQYWNALTTTPDYVAMFIPSDNLFSAAIEKDNALFDDAISKNVLIVTPTTLIALIKAISYGWRQEKVAENAQKVSELGRDLYRRIQTLSGHVTKLGTSMTSSVKHYNSFVGSLESSVLSQARKFSELEIEGTKDSLPNMDPIDQHTREIKSTELLEPNKKVQ